MLKIMIMLALLFLFIFVIIFLVSKNYTGFFASKYSNNFNTDVFEDNGEDKSSNWHIIGTIKIENGKIVALSLQNFSGSP